MMYYQIRKFGRLMLDRYHSLEEARDACHKLFRDGQATRCEIVKVVTHETPVEVLYPAKGFNYKMF